MGRATTDDSAALLANTREVTSILASKRCPASFRCGNYERPPIVSSPHSCFLKKHGTHATRILEEEGVTGVLREGKKMVRLHRVIQLLVSIEILLLVAGCVQSTVGSGNKDSQSELNATPGTAHLVKAGMAPTTASLHPSPPPTVPTQLIGAVTLHITAVPQQVSDSLVLTLTNSTNQTILFPDHLTECSVVLLSMQPPSVARNGTWQIVAPCRAETATRLHTLEAAKRLTIILIPPNGQWSPGLYRGQLNYLLSGIAHQPQTVFSSSVQVGS